MINALAETRGVAGGQPFGWGRKVAGSNPAAPTNKIKDAALI